MSKSIGTVRLRPDAEGFRLMHDTVPSKDEITLVLEILDTMVAPALDKIERLLETAGNWDNVARNDFCRQVLSTVLASFQIYTLSDTYRSVGTLGLVCRL